MGVVELSIAGVLREMETRAAAYRARSRQGDSPPSYWIELAEEVDRWRAAIVELDILSPDQIDALIAERRRYREALERIEEVARAATKEG